MKPFFSVIIPTLNEEKYLPKILTQLTKQTDKDFEVIIADGSSEDTTKEVALSFKKLPLRFFELKKQNVSYQRNFGASQAKGKYLFFLDADCQISYSFIKTLKNVVNKKKGLIIIPYLLPDERSTEVKLMFQMSNFLVELSQNFNKPFSNSGTMIIEKNFFHLIGGFPENVFLSEDHLLVQKARQWGVQAKFVPQLKVKFNLRRWRREGKLKFIYKYLLAIAHLLFKGDVKKKIFDYQMGGQNKKLFRKKAFFNSKLKDSFKQLKKFFKKNLL